MLIGALFGPMQVAGRVLEFTVGKNLRAQAVGTLAFAVLAVALLLLSQVRGVMLIGARVRAALRIQQRGDDHRARHGAGGDLWPPRISARCSDASRARSLSRAPARPSRWRSASRSIPARTITPYLLVALGLAALIAYRRRPAPAPRALIH